MPQPGEAFEPQPAAEDSFLDLLAETLQALDESVRGQFLREYFRAIAHTDFTEAQSNDLWVRILQRRRELSESLAKKVSLKTVILDVLASGNFFRVPILMEYEELKKLQVNAATDALTGLQNRRLFDEYCDKELTRAKRYGQPLAIVVLDLHKLKEVNDSHGHLQGDKVLQLAATTFGKTLRASDFAFRIGGDEFALLLPQTDTEQAAVLSNRVRAQFEADLRQLNLGVGATLDFGVAVHPQDGDQKGQLMGLADERLYQQKHSGRAASRAVPPESHPPPSEPPATATSTAAAAPAEPRDTPPAAWPPTEHRKWERVSLAGTKAHAVLTENGQTTAKVIDLSYGGVALQFEKSEDFPNQFNAVLHVPILPPVRVVLRTVHAQPLEGGRIRVGCSFVS
ncbi:MAG: diguanylate cyclase domain-containing protein [Candidatus Acidiferrales bacterium]